MRQNAHSGAGRFLGEEFNPFLFALVGTDRFGNPLSVISALARLDLDAWAEAAALVRLPRDVAARKLSAQLKKFTEIPQIAQNAGGIAVCLIALLPPSGAAPSARLGSFGRWVVPGGAVLAILLCATLLLTMQYIVPHTPLAAPPAGAAPPAIVAQ